MARGELTKEQLKGLNEKVPEVVSLQKRTLGLSPVSVAAAYPNDSRIPTAAVCLSDSAGTLCEVRYALFEYNAHRFYFRKIAGPDERSAAVFFERYYLDDAAYRLYSAAEDVAQAIIHTLELSKDALRAHKNGATSAQAIVGRYLQETQPDKPPASIIKRLTSSPSWSQTRKYRDACVHDQPPLVEGPGIAYLRKNMWKVDPDTKARTLVVGGGDKPALTTEAIYDFVMPAFLDFVGVLDDTVTWYKEVVQSETNGTWRIKYNDE